jgi:hypothetical protein
MDFSKFMVIGGILQLGVLIAAGILPIVLDWKTNMPKLPKLQAQIFKVYALYICIMILSIGGMCIVYADEMLAGTPLTKALCFFVAFFWGVRLMFQLFYYDPTGYLDRGFYRVGYHGLTAVFTYQVFIFAAAGLL